MNEMGNTPAPFTNTIMPGQIHSLFIYMSTEGVSATLNVLKTKVPICIT